MSGHDRYVPPPTPALLFFRMRLRKADRDQIQSEVSTAACTHNKSPHRSSLESECECHRRVHGCSRSGTTVGERTLSPFPIFNCPSTADLRTALSEPSLTSELRRVVVHFVVCIVDSLSAFLARLSVGALADSCCSAG